MLQQGVNMKLSIAVIILFGFIATSYAEETIAEKAKVTVDSAKRSAKKGLHRTQEAICGKLTGDDQVKCLAKKAKNRVDESGTLIKDKASEIKNSVDTDKK